LTASEWACHAGQALLLDEQISSLRGWNVIMIHDVMCFVIWLVRDMSGA
jgi:putative lipase involved disintegration of autophagic bodies